MFACVRNLQLLDVGAPSGASLKQLTARQTVNSKRADDEDLMNILADLTPLLVVERQRRAYCPWLGLEYVRFSVGFEPSIDGPRLWCAAN